MFVNPVKSQRGMKNIGFLEDLKLEIRIWMTRLSNLTSRRTLSTREKSGIIKLYRERFSTDYFVETGTYIGDMVVNLRNDFKHIITIELSGELFRRAEKRLKRYKHVRMIRGDSGEVINKILLKTNKPTLFWLDAHFSGGVTAMTDKHTPVKSELKAIMKHRIKTHVVLVDDADMFDGSFGYPKVSELRHMVKRLAPKYLIENKDGIIRIHP